MQYQIHHGDNRDVLKAMEDNSIDSIVTDPPYELGFMGKSWDASGIAFNTEVWQECLRVLKPGGHLLAFSGSRTYHRMAVAIEDAGFEIRDQIMWIYGSGFPKSHNLKDNWQGWGTALKPAHEPIVVARKPLIGTVAANVLTYGTGGLNIDGARVGNEGGTKLEVKERDAGLYAPGTGLLNRGYGEVVEGLGRWPANVIHDGSDEVVELFPDTGKSGIAINRNRSGAKSGEVFQGGWNALTEDVGFHDSGSAARFFYCAKASKRDRNEGLDGFNSKQTVGGGGGIGDYLDDVNSASGKYGSEKAPQANHHPTVKPTDLMRYLCRLVTPPSGTVLDPFMGSGSTGKAAIYEGFNFVGIEMTDEYLPIAKARIEFALKEINEQEANH
jgi:site-specific DNA-methyltransferase (adenine-specific)